MFKRSPKENNKECKYIDDLNDLEPWEYATEIGEKWGVGKAEEDNGIILLIKPTEKTSRREVFIAVGRGLESVVPDLTANEIVQNELLPNFKNQAYFEGVKQAVKVLSELSKGEYSHNKYSKKNKKGDLKGLRNGLNFPSWNTYAPDSK